MKDHKNTNENIRLKIREIKELKLLNAFSAKKMEDELIISLAYLVHSATYKYKKFGNYDDLYQEGMIGLIRAVQKYNSDTTFHFTRYALWWIKTRIIRSIKKMNIMNVPNNMDMKYLIQLDINENDIIDYSDPEKNILLTEESEIINSAISKLPESHQEIIKMRYGFNNSKQHNLQDISDELDITREGIRRLQHRILNTLKANNTLND